VVVASTTKRGHCPAVETDVVATQRSALLVSSPFPTSVRSANGVEVPKPTLPLDNIDIAGIDVVAKVEGDDVPIYKLPLIFLKVQ
jgi:hypothetical protein